MDVQGEMTGVLLQCECCALDGRQPVNVENPEQNECFKATGLVEYFRKRVKLTCLRWQPYAKPFYCDKHFYSPPVGSGMCFCPRCEMPNSPICGKETL